MFGSGSSSAMRARTSLLNGAGCLVGDGAMRLSGVGVAGRAPMLNVAPFVSEVDVADDLSALVGGLLGLELEPLSTSGAIDLIARLDLAEYRPRPQFRLR